jgi:uncharacterized protein
LLTLNLGFLLHQSVGTSRDFDFDFPDISLGDDLNLSTLSGTLRMTRTSGGIYGNGKFEAEMDNACVRCLSSFTQDLSTEIDELFEYPARAGTEPLLRIPESGLLNLRPLLREQFVLAAPIRSLCQPDCKGICQDCGINLNEDICDHPQEDLDPRLAVLKSLLDES